jgi:hypothetical protein
MLRWITYSFLFSLLSLILSGCGGGGGGGSSASSSNPPAGTSSSIILSWETPVSQADGKPLADISGFNIYYGNSSLAYSERIDAGNIRTYTLENLPSGTYYLAITAYDSVGNETDFSSGVVKNIP